VLEYILLERSALETASAISGRNVNVVGTRESAVVLHIGTITAHAGCAAVKKRRGGKVGTIEPIPVLTGISGEKQIC
jgi:hypothetical protein